MKIIAFVFLFLFGLFFTTPYKIISVTQQEVVGGRQESGKSTVYLFKAVAKKGSDKLSFEDLWIGTTYYSIEASHQDDKNVISKDFIKGDTIYFQAIKRFLPDENGDLKLAAQLKNKQVPMEYTGKALIGYSFKGKKHYYPVEEITTLKRENRP